MLSVLIEFAIRCLMVALFLPFSALDKVLNLKRAISQASQAIPNRVFASLLIAGGFCVEVVMSLAVLTGVADRLAALILAGYCLLTALLWKQFWTKPDFRLKGASNGRDVFWDLPGAFFSSPSDPTVQVFNNCCITLLRRRNPT